MHNYILKIQRLIESGKLDPGVGVHDLQIFHDDWCKMLVQFGECDCNPDLFLDGVFIKESE